MSQEVFNAMVLEIIVFGPMNQIKDRLNNLFDCFQVLSEPETDLVMVKEEQGPLDENGSFTVFRTYMRKL
ncbi:MAG TPA: hypothetical protein PKW79_00145 [Rhabdochlamydiaceae bacterium]|nr:hypothetical protein [Rhabdochlamydiaceae bacterium]